MTEERRAFQRLHLTELVEGRFGDCAVQLLEVSATGTHVRCGTATHVGDRAPLRFRWRDEDVEVAGEIVWTEDDRAGLRFTEYPDVLRRLLADAVTDLLRAQEPAEPPAPRVFATDDFPLANVFVSYSFDGGKWTRKPSLRPEQPANGFTLPADHDAEQVELLCRNYESGDDEARRLTRMYAELSVSR